MTNKTRVLKKHDNAYARYLMVSVGESTRVVVISLAGDGEDVGVGFTAAQAWADAARRLTPTRRTP